jgi:glycosyltransferase involved in cell wall biosynthesis
MLEGARNGLLAGTKEVGYHRTTGDAQSEISASSASCEECMSKLSVAVLLSGREQFSVYYGGALARWTYEVYSRLRDHVDVKVYGFPTDPESAYPLPFESSAWSRACTLMARVPVARRYEDSFWLRLLNSRLQNAGVVHIHNRPQWASLLRRLGYRGTVIVHLQNDHLGHWSTTMGDALAADLDGLVVCSSYLQSVSIGQSAALKSKARIVFNGVNTRLFFPKQESRELKTIFFVGSFIPAKGAKQLLEAYARVLRNHPDAKLVIGGTTSFGIHQETEYVRNVRQLAASVEKEQGGCIDFPGYIHHDRELPAFFQKATLFSSPSIFQEPFGLVNAEAMACATPVVGSNRGGIPEVLGDTGRLIDPENVAQYADVLSALLHDYEERQRLGRSALERCRRMFDWDVIAATWLTYLQEVSSKKLQALECA